MLRSGEDEKTAAAKDSADEKKATEKKDEKKPVEVKIDFTDLASRLSEVPAPAGNYGSLQATDKRLCWLNATDEVKPKASLQCLDIANKGDEQDTSPGRCQELRDFARPEEDARE